MCRGPPRIALHRVCAGPQAWCVCVGGSTASVPRLSFSLVKLHHMDAESELFHTETGFLKNSHFMPIA